jgi:hypothetical protein
MAFLRTTRIRLALLLALLASVPLQLAQPQLATRQEYALKAVFLYNFCRFIEWPDQAFATPDAPIVIGVIGQDPFGLLLEETVRGERLRGRTIVIERYRRAADARDAHLLFVSGSESGRTGEILAAVAGRSIVTVGETEEFLDRGGMIALTAAQDRVRLRINPNRLRAESLVASSKLLRVAEIRL